jgi:hypothetical protein
MDFKGSSGDGLLFYLLCSAICKQNGKNLVMCELTVSD